MQDGRWPSFTFIKIVFFPLGSSENVPKAIILSIDSVGFHVCDSWSQVAQNDLYEPKFKLSEGSVMEIRDLSVAGKDESVKSYVMLSSVTSNTKKCLLNEPAIPNYPFPLSIHITVDLKHGGRLQRKSC